MGETGVGGGREITYGRVKMECPYAKDNPQEKKPVSVVLVPCNSDFHWTRRSQAGITQQHVVGDWSGDKKTGVGPCQVDNLPATR